ncbi:hypothetical protein BKG95_08435 [Rodentibacter pneumotropicus]|uniref:Uncharacterized protein n=1 Tax=Rodentibacter pneumotropicus TaxID=758 RepID=A0AAW5L6M2_9PAST|nr:hypothetical protein [Rodentibacter pneumotropicus]MCQ9120249.1 hypothetical protein [Rodentibacter pneumotropicus]NBH75621.1 hypothetical protein [Rodentibacter pneumotropicus]OOF67068.1 hypothetical protein BKG95_08435 [Rodentibacter pneumotropicus]THA06033.1 hypothetical protein D3M73_05705 [Rodentibacter pneumotropicus]THA13622.1 hypothetical protein D3M81_01955 [Rodentibacter pneumotropicus]
MFHLNDTNFKREPYRGYCPKHLKDLFTKPRLDIKGNGHYFSQNEYVVAWYESDFIFENRKAQVRAKVKLVNLTNPIYIGKDNAEYLSVLYISVPLNYLHYFTIGSIWKNGVAKEQFAFEEFYIMVKPENQDSERENLSMVSFNESSNSSDKPFDYTTYTIPTEHHKYRDDQNKLLSISYQNQKFIIHPLHIFMMHYGYSTDIKRILATYSFDEVKERLFIDKVVNNFDVERYVVLPKYFVKKDAIFLYHFKYDEDTTGLRVKNLVSQFRLNVRNQKHPIEIGFWHTQKVELKIRGIRLGNAVLCAEIIGLNQPEGEDITLVQYQSKGQKSDSKTEEQNRDINNVPITRIYTREPELDELPLTDNSPDNRTVEYNKRQFELLGRQRQIRALKKAREEHNQRMKILTPDEIGSLGVGESDGRNGSVGLAFCFLDDTPVGKSSKLYKLWQHAKAVAEWNYGEAHWYTPNLGFRNDDELVPVSLETNRSFDYPEIAIIIRLEIHGETFFLIDFSMKHRDISMRGLGYKPDPDEDFLYETDMKKSGLSELLSAVHCYEHLPKEYLEDKNKGKTKLTTFNHSEADSSNWAYNAVQKLTSKAITKPIYFNIL